MIGGILAGALTLIILFDLIAFVFWNAEEYNYKKLSRLCFLASIISIYIIIYTLAEALDASFF